MGIGAFYIPLVLYIIGNIIAALAIFIGPELGLAYLVLLMPLQNIIQKIHAFPFGKNLVDILVVSMVLGWIIKRGRKGGGLFEKTPLDIPVLLYVVVTFMSLVWGSIYLHLDFPIDLDNVRFSEWKNLMILPVVYFITINNVRDLKSIRLVLMIALFSVVLTDLFFYREFSWYKEWHYTHGMRVSGPFFYLGANELGAFFAQYGVFVLGLFLVKKGNLAKILFGLIFVANIYCLMYTFSRAGYFACLTGISFILFLQGKKWLILFIILLAVSPRFLPVSVMERVEMTTLSEEERAEGQTFDGSTEARFTYTEKAIEFLKESPVLGTGYSTFAMLVGRDTHNNYAKFLAEGGILGFGVYIFLYLVSIRIGWGVYRGSRDDFSRGLGLGLMGCIVTNMMVNISHDCWSYLNLMGLYWVMLGLVARCNLVVKEEVRMIDR